MSVTTKIRMKNLEPTCICVFILLINSNHWCISHCFWDKWW